MKFLSNLYYLYWHDYLCRLECFTDQWRRYTKKWWWVILIKVGIVVGIVLWLLLFPPFILPFWVKITIIVLGVIVIAFYSWVLLHLGGFAMKIKEWLWR